MAHDQPGRGVAAPAAQRLVELHQRLADEFHPPVLARQRLQDGAWSVAGLVGGLAVLLVAFLVGGWVAGRMARYDGARQRAG